MTTRKVLTERISGRLPPENPLSIVKQVDSGPSSVTGGFDEDLSDLASNRKAFGDRLRQLKGEMTEAALGAAIGASQTAVNGYLNGASEPKRSTLIRIADHFSVSLDWLMTGRVSDIARKGDVAQADLLAVPFYDIRVSAGPGSHPLGEEPAQMLGVDPKLLQMLGLRPQDAAIMSVHGDSAEPSMSEGDFIIVDRSASELRDGGMYVIGIDDDVLVKRVERLVNRSLLLRSDNPAYSPQTVSQTDAERLRVLGRVKWAIRPF